MKPPPPSATPVFVKPPSATPSSSSSVKHPPSATPSSLSVKPPSATASSMKRPVPSIAASSMKRPRRSIAASPLKPLPVTASTSSSDSSDSDIEFVDGPAACLESVPEVQFVSGPHVPPVSIMKVLTNMKDTEEPTAGKSGQAVNVDGTTSSSSGSSEEDQLDDTILVDALGSSGAFPKKRDLMPGPEDDELDYGTTEEDGM